MQACILLTRISLNEDGSPAYALVSVDRILAVYDLTPNDTDANGHGHAIVEYEDGTNSDSCSSVHVRESARTIADMLAPRVDVLRLLETYGTEAAPQ